MPPPEEVEMRRLWHLGELVSPSVKRSMVSVALQVGRRQVWRVTMFADCVPTYCISPNLASIPDSTPDGTISTSCRSHLHPSTFAMKVNLAFN